VPAASMGRYARRIARALAKGLTRSQARGHPKPGEKAVSPHRPRFVLNSEQLQRALRSLQQQKNLAAAAREARIAPERLKREATRRRAIVKRRGRWIVRLNLPRRMLLYSDGKAVMVTVGRFSSASLIGRFMAAVGKFLRLNDQKLLQPFVGQSVTDISGKKHSFETNPNTLYRLTSANGETFEQVYRIVV
jgi:hypothetical protein